MNSRELEKQMDLKEPQIFTISPKTSAATLQRWARERWRSEDRKGVAKDIVGNVRELSIVSEPELNRVLQSIHYFSQFNQCRKSFGQDAIAVNSARTIGGLGALANWPMHAPQMVYLSIKCLIDMAGSGDELEALKRKMREGALDYGDEHLPSPYLYIEILDFLSQPRNGTGKTNIQGFVKDLASLLGAGNVDGVHNKILWRQSKQTGAEVF